MARRQEKFKTGNICRIYIKNFLTLNEVEVRPKSKLNFICGANGSGKSTVLCAVCLCLGGKTSDMGRGKAVYDYVKMGEEEATLEVEIHVEKQINVVVSCRINQKKHKTLWFLQGREVSRKTVMEKMVELNIQMDSLCQFLPQDRVADFALMNSQQLLVATEKAVGDPTLHQQHKTLCDSGQEFARLQKRETELKGEVGQADRRTARLKGVVENLELKQKLLKELEDLKTQEAWYRYDYKRKMHQESKEDLKLMKEEKNKLQSDPAINKIKEKNATLANMKRLIKRKNEKVFKLQEQERSLKTKCDDLVEGLKDEKRNYANKEQEERARQTELLDYRRQLTMLEGQLLNIPELDEAEFDRQLKTLTDQIFKASQRTVRLQSQLGDLVGEKEAKERSRNANTKELATLQDVRGQRLELLRSFNQDAYKATQWVQNNRHNFEGLVYPPICALLNITNQRYVHYVENRIAERDLVAFVCENKNDVNKLKEEMDRQHLCVNIVHANPDLLQNFKPKHSIRELKKYGFETYMLDCVEAPKAILSFLCQNYAIHAVPIGTTGNYDNVPPAVTVFYLEDSRYSRTRSRYDGQMSTTIYPIGKARLLQIVEVRERVAELQATIKDLNARIEKEGEGVIRLQEEERALSKKLEGWRSEKRTLASRKEERKLLERRIGYKETQIQGHVKNAINLKAEKVKTDRTIKLCIREQVRVVGQLMVNMEATAAGVCECMRAEGKVKVVGRELQRLMLDAGEWRERKAAMERGLEEKGQVLEKLKLEARDALNRLMSRLGIMTVQEINEEIRQKFQNSSLEDTERLLAEKEAHLDCLVTASSAELQEFKDGLKKLTRLQEELRDVGHNLQTYQLDLEGVKGSWLPHITTLVGDINNKFSQFMANMGYAGEVTLNADEDDFSTYGIAIKVKFRDAQRLQQLTAQQQSGGERAVSTALYMLALQSLSTAPFRCVDEINQGMDKINEKKMLEMLMETEGSEDSSQYFFVTPKLLQDISYSGSVNVMVVFNSPNTISHRRFTMQRCLKRQKERNRN